MTFKNLLKNRKLCLIIAASVLAVAIIVGVVLWICLGGKPDDGPGKDDPGTNNTETFKTEWPEAGVYYFDDVNFQNTLTLNVGDTFSLYVKGELSAGKYTLTDSQLVLDFNAEGISDVTATYEGDVISLTYNNASMRLLKKLNYTVSFNVDGGSEVAAQTVLNGKGASKPADPTRPGFVFVGWYADAEFKNAYAFGSAPVTADTTVYARWIAESVTGKEYTVKLDANYEDAAVLADEITTGGKLFDLPVLDREGYTFGGWWFSTESDGNKLSYKYEDNMSINANITLFALWTAKPTDSKLAVPIVNVTANNISWNSVENARAYDVKIIAEDGEVMVDASTAATVMNVSFGDWSAGKYEIVVTAKANSGEQNDSVATRYYVNKALTKVSEFFVDGSVLVFNTVENAEKYLITVVCGNPEHNHSAFDNGSSRTFNFANCTMTASGIQFTVTAVADGYASSTSDVFTVTKNLDSVSGFRFDEATQTLVWNEVASAESYMVSVKCGNSAHNHDFVNFGTQTYVSLKECDALEGGIVVKVYAKSEGYNSPAASEYVFNKAVLGTPANLLLNGNVLSWDAVAGAEKYEVTVNGTAYESTTTSLDLASVLDVIEGLEYTLTVQAKGTTDSLVSDALVACYYELNEKVSYANGKLSWTPVIGAQYYEIQVNDGEIVRVEGGAYSALVTLNKKGENLVKVRFVDGKNVSDWATTTVTAHRVIFDTLGGEPVDNQFKAVGDPITLPTTEKAGYNFVAWYNVPGGATSNGAAYNDAIFAESGDIVLYGYYSAKKYEIIYNYGVGGTGSLTSDWVSFDGNYTLTVPTASSVAGAFGGWFSAPYGMGVQYTDGSGNSLAPWSLTEGKELYAFWVDETLSFTPTRVNGKDVYAVSKGARIALVTELTIPATYRGLPVAFIAGNAFTNCSNLEVINLPETIEQISMISPFEGCSSLVAINVYDVEGVASPAFTSVEGVLLDIGTPGTTKIALVPMAKTGTFRIPEGVTEIPEAAFASSSISKVIITPEVTTIGREAFKDNASLTSVVFEVNSDGTSVPLTIGIRAFMNCTSLEKITLPARLTDIKLQRYSFDKNGINTTEGDSAFTGCTALASIAVASNSQNYMAIDSILYSKNGQNLLFVPASVQGTFVVPEGTKNIGAGAFIGCHFVTEVTLPGSLVLISECAFYGLENLEAITFNGVALNDLEVDKYAFMNCKVLETVTFNEGSRLGKLGESAFEGCESLKEFTFAATMSSVGASAFANCTALQTVNFVASQRTLSFGENAFMNCTGLKTVNLPANVSKIPGVFTGCSSLEAVNVDENSQYLTSVEGVVYDKAMTEIVFFPQGKSGDFELPATITSITNGVFQNVNLGTLTISNTVTFIGDDAFNSAKIDTFTFEGEATGTLTIGANAFKGADIGTLALPAHTVSIGDYAFYETVADSITLNEGIVSLGEYAFWGADLDLTVPASVKTIGAYCFGGYEDWWEGIEAYPNVTLTVENSQLETIGDSAFRENIFVEDLIIPASVKTIGNYAFMDCLSLGKVTFEADSVLETIGAYAFAYGSSWDASYDFTEITIPATVQTIGAYAFAYTKLESVVIEDGTADLVIGTTFADTYYNESMGMYQTDIYRGNTFYYCQELKEVVLPSRLTVLGNATFKYAGYYADELSITISGDNPRLTTIGEECFYNSNLVSFVIPKSVHNLPAYTDPISGETYDRLGIGANAFYGLYDTLNSITFEMGGDLPLTIGANAFYNAALLESVVLPARLSTYTSYTGDVITPLANGARVFESCDLLASVTVEDASGAYYTSVDGVLMTADKKELVFYPMARAGEFTVPSTVTKIHSYAFYEASDLTNLVFEGGSDDMYIGEYAFARCTGLTNVVLSNNVVSLGGQAFARCTGLESLTLSEKLQSFHATIISNCSKLAAINVGANGQGVYFSSIDGVLYNADKSALIVYPLAKTNEELIVDANVKVIYTTAFANNTYITKVVLPEGLVEIQSNAFEFCYGLKEVNIPSTVQKIDTRAFYYCSALDTVTFTQGSDDLLIIGDNAFANTSSLKSIALPARLYSIGNNTFYLTGLESITFAENSALVEIGDYAFSQTPVIELAIPAGVVKIGNFAFFDCKALLSITFQEGLISIGDYAFAGSDELLSVSFPASLKTLGASVFYYYDYDEYTCSSLESVTFAPNSQLEAIPAGTFAYTALKTFTVPASVTVIEGTETNPSDKMPSAFYEVTTLESVYFENGSQCAEIGAYTFESSSLKSIELPTSVSTIGMYAFRYCASLESIVIPETVTNIGEGAFWQCRALTEVDFRSKTTELNDYLFYGCESLTEITIPASVSVIAVNAFEKAGLAAFNVDPRNTTYKAVDGILYTADGTGIVMIPAQMVITNFVVPNTVTSIGERLFYKLSSLETLVFEGGRTMPITIGTEAFAECTNLRSIEFTEMITSIGVEAFYGCSALTTVTIPSDMTESVFVTELYYGEQYSGAFYYCSSLIEVCNKSQIELEPGSTKCGYLAAYAIRVYSEGESSVASNNGFTTITLENGDIYLLSYTGSETNVTIPEGITHIYAGAFGEGVEHVTFASTVKVVMSQAFYGSTVKTVTLNEGLEVIDEDAFYYSDLESLTLPTTVKKIGESAFYGSALQGSIALPESLETIGSGAFYYVEDMITFLVPVASAPEGWAADWNEYDYYDNHMVLWGFTGEEITYTFNTMGGSAVESITSAEPITLPAAPTRENYIFNGWYDNEACEGEALTGPYYNGTVTTIYAKWMTQEEFDAQFAGTSFEYAIELQLGETKTYFLAERWEEAYYKITVTESGNYTFSLIGGDTYMCGYDDPEGYYNWYNYSEWNGEDYVDNIKTGVSLEAGVTYYIVFYSYNDNTELTITVTKD